MSTPTIPAGNLFMNATTYSGNSSTQTVTNGSAGASFQPDFIWIKNRTGANDNNVYDSVRGSTSGYYYELITNGTVAENYYSPGNYGMVSAINSNGFTVASSNSNWNLTNATGNNYVAWQWKAGGTAVSNTSGTITSSVSANTTSGFSIVTYTGTGNDATVGHGLGVAPSFIIAKCKSQTGNWQGYHSALGKNYSIKINTTDAQENIANYWGTGGVTSSVVGLTGGGYQINISGGSQILYCWAPIAGYSAFGSYTGNGSADGPFVYLGFRPKFVLLKVSSGTTANWVIVDTSRDTYNVMASDLNPDSSGAEYTNTVLDCLSNGFKIRNTPTTYNGSGYTYIYACFAENPFKYANAR